MKFIWGLLIGAGLGLLFAPASGEQTRERLSQSMDEMKESAINRGREKAGDWGREAGERLFDKAVGEER